MAQTTQRVQMTPLGYRQLVDELEQLQKTGLPEAIDRVAKAREFGDLSENAEYHEAREEQGALEDRISQLETILASAEIVEVHHSNTVEIGSKATITKQGSKDSRVFTIVGSEEINTEAGKISFKSPLGSALLGKKKGEEFSVKTPGGDVTYTVVSIA